MKNNKEFLFVIDTDSYSGNFERELTAYCTGQTGDCGVGSNISNKFQEDFTEIYKNIEKIIKTKSNDYGYFRPCKIWPTPGYWNDGMGNHWKDEDWDTEKVIKAFNEELKLYKKSHHSYIGSKNIQKYAAYQSVAIFFAKKPSDKIINFIKKRAIEYLESNKVKVNKFKIIQVEMVSTQIVIWEEENE